MTAGSGNSGWLHRAADSDIWWSFKSSPMTVAAAIGTVLIVAVAFLSPVLAPHTPFDPATLSLSDGLKPPVLLSADGDWAFPLGTDDQGRDILSSIMYGTRLSLVVGFASVAVAMTLGITLGLLSGYLGGAVDALIMRIADVQLTFPAILVALLIDGIVRGIISVKRHDEIAIYVIVGAIGLSFWVQYARTVRGSVMVEKNKEYVQAARVIGLSPILIMVRHVLPNVTGPVLVIATINLGLAIITEATLSFLGVGLPSTEPSLGTLIRLGNEVLQSGDWWITVFPGVTLAALVLAVNLLGDWLRDALNPKLR
ncbi:ABC transporter permease [Reyranella sp. MMS21-HV4-11]|jgi:peptide/nickel transport system permease protein|uniref:ABC transporter permease n=1 Tax=Reyranella humidisoli TaxID=2849149 RepID=A0ABS6ING9_9HYPH|nr:ABC transporter permease [Reyranella sp. MMS21-HV4-11]MBU8875282.1 ABC transporter permease [Reyranella sp. MMS21-HV4-11]